MFQQFLFINGVSVPLPEEFYVRDHKTLTYTLEQIVNAARLPESAEVSFTYEVYYTYNVEKAYCYAGEKRFLQRRLRMFLTVDEKTYTVNDISEGTYVNNWEIGTQIRINRDPYGWKDYCFEKRRRQYFGPKKPKPINVVC